MKNYSILDSCYIKFTWFLRMETTNIPNPPIFDCKLQVVLFAVIINEVHSETALNYECVVLAYITFLQDELSALNPSFFEILFHKSLLFLF